MATLPGTESNKGASRFFREAPMVGGAGSRRAGPAIPRRRDYEPNEPPGNCAGSSPVAVQKPCPRFWALSCNSRSLAAR